MKEYNHKEVEEKWQKHWEELSPFQAGKNPEQKKSYLLVEFPYPSGEGLHVGHVKSYAAMDVIARTRRRMGHDVLYPIGWDAFGLPTENFAIKTGKDPRLVTKENTDTFRRQLKSLGLSFDWSREINTTDPNYYRWTQWIFIQMWKKGLAYKSKTEINWCPKCKIGLANEEVVANACERCGYAPVEKREKEQWMLAITKYAKRLHDDLDAVDYIPEAKIQQRNWIGPSEGAEIEFSLLGIAGQEDRKHKVKIFTTRPDTIYGATFLAIAPELAKKWIDIGWKTSPDVHRFVSEELKRRSEEKYIGETEKRGIDAGIVAINPANDEKIPVWIVNYVLGNVGTGAIMAVPAHDERDFAFAKAYHLPIRRVVHPFVEHPDVLGKGEREKKRKVIGVVEHEGKYLSIHWKPELGGRLFLGGTIEKDESPETTVLRELAEETGYTDAEVITVSDEHFHYDYYAYAKEKAFSAEIVFVHLRLRSLAQQAQALEHVEKGKFTVEWVTPAVAQKEIQNPPHKRAFELFIQDVPYTGEGILAASGPFDSQKSTEAKKKITEALGGMWTTTYKLRDWVFSRQRYWGEPIPMIYCETDGWNPVPENELPVLLPDVKKYEPTDTGESPLAKVETWVKAPCPVCGKEGRRETDVMPNWAGSSWYYLRYTDPENDQAPASREALSRWLPVDWYNGGMEHTTLHLLYSRFWHKFLFDLGIVPTPEPYAKRTSHGLILAAGGEKMSKSKGNVVNPDDIVRRFGADTLRVYEMFMGPFEAAIAWNEDNLMGARRFLERVWRLSDRVKEEALLSDNDERLLHLTIQKVGEDIESMKFNTAISAMMILLNALEKTESVPVKAYETLLILLAPFAPHITEELWEQSGHKESIHSAPGPVFDPQKLTQETVTIAVQIAGKVRGTITLSPEAEEKEALKRALDDEKIVKWLDGKPPKKIVYKKGKVLNIIS